MAHRRSFSGITKKIQKTKSKLDEPLVTDRPDFTESSTTVGQGVVQLEMGYTFTGDSSGRRAHGQSFVSGNAVAYRHAGRLARISTRLEL